MVGWGRGKRGRIDRNREDKREGKGGEYSPEQRTQEGGERGG